MSISQDILSQIYGVIQSDVALHFASALEFSGYVSMGVLIDLRFAYTHMPLVQKSFAPALKR